MEVKLESLNLKHAEDSFKWRNDPKVWEKTVNRPDKKISKKDEIAWMKGVLNNENEARFAIIANNNYVGNVYLTDITNKDALFHIFIGEKSYWGKGVGKKSCKLILSYGFNELKLEKINLRVLLGHNQAIRLYSKIGFKEIWRDNDLLYMEINRKDLI